MHKDKTYTEQTSVNTFTLTKIFSNEFSLYFLTPKRKFQWLMERKRIVSIYIFPKGKEI